MEGGRLRQKPHACLRFLFSFLAARALTELTTTIITSFLPRFTQSHGSIRLATLLQSLPCYFSGICKVKALARLAGLLWGLRISPVRRSIR